MTPPDRKEQIDVENLNPYSRGETKGKEVEEMFDSIAPAYDFMNTAMTFGLHRNWRDTALDRAAEAFRELSATTPASILDVATGTGEVALEMHRRWPKASITGVDLSEGMLDIARRKLASLPEAEKKLIAFEAGDCLALRFPDNTFDMVTVAYGVRNFEKLLQGYREIYRVLRPGGILCVIELSEPENRLTHAAYRFYSRTLIPLAGKLISRDPRAYTYLPESIAAAPQRRDMARLMQQAGFRRCRWQSLTFGAVTFYLAQKQ